MPHDKEGTVEFDNCKVTRETDKAILCEIDGESYWIPQSHVHENSEVWREGDEGKLVITEWIAIEKKLV